MIRRRARALLWVGVAVALLPWLWRSVPRWLYSFRTSSMPSASLYDALFGRLFYRLYGRIAEDVASRGMRGELLEVGSGPGQLALFIARTAPDLKVTGVDISPDMVRLATSQAEKAGLQDRVCFQEADVGALPFEDERFDLVATSLSMHHWPDPIRGLREICRVLKPEGVALVYDLPGWFAQLESRGPLIEEIAASASVGEVELDGFSRIGPVAMLLRLTIRKNPRCA